MLKDTVFPVTYPGGDFGKTDLFLAFSTIKRTVIPGLLPKLTSRPSVAY